eukprot:COSAG02_NODE_6738_length_3393_cov_2.353673_2_plen_71_part_00
MVRCWGRSWRCRRGGLALAVEALERGLIAETAYHHLALLIERHKHLRAAWCTFFRQCVAPMHTLRASMTL